MPSNREIASTIWSSVRENLTRGRFRLVPPGEAVGLIADNKAALATVHGTGRPPGPRNPSTLGIDDSVIQKTAEALLTILRQRGTLPFQEDQIVGFYSKHFPEAQRPRVAELYAAVQYLRWTRQIVGATRGWVLRKQ